VFGDRHAAGIGLLLVRASPKVHDQVQIFEFSSGARDAPRRVTG
jgi:hypothetical protein